jgi:ABC-2 type transport system permease protein
MSKFWTIIAYEYSRNVFRRRFLFGLLSIPLMLVGMVLLFLLVLNLEFNNRPVGYVDHSGLLADPVPPPMPAPPDRPVKFIAYPAEADAEAALQAEQIQAYFVLDEDYLKTAHAELVSLKDPSVSARSQFVDLVRANLLRNQPATIQERLKDGNHLTVRAADGSQEVGENEWLNLLLPFFAGFAFMIAVFTTSGYLMQAVVEEKENYTMEVLLTSVSSQQLMAGKIISMVAVGWTQLLVWGGLAIAALLIGRNYSEELAALRISPGLVAVSVAAFIPSFVMIAALMVAIGATVTDVQEGNQIASLFTIPVVIPYWFTVLILTNPNGPLAVGLSFFPFTAPVTLSMRAGMTVIPFGQLVLNLAFLWLCALGALWIAGRAFRLGMLRYGQRLPWREIFARPARRLAP